MCTSTKGNKGWAALKDSHLVAVVSLVRGTSRGVREDVGLRMLIGPKLLLARLQQQGGLHHVLLVLVVFEASPQHACIEPVFISAKTDKESINQQLNIRKAC